MKNSKKLAVKAAVLMGTMMVVAGVAGEAQAACTYKTVNGITSVSCTQTATQTGSGSISNFQNFDSRLVQGATSPTVYSGPSLSALSFSNLFSWMK